MDVLAERKPDVLVYSGHGDVPLGGRCTLAFVQEGGAGLEAVTPDALAHAVGAQSVQRGGRLRVLLLNGCCTEALGKAAVRAGIEHVVCWRTRTADEPARAFGVEFVRRLAAGHAVEAAFEAAQAAQLVLTVPGRDDAGHAATVPKYARADPDDAALVQQPPHAQAYRVKPPHPEARYAPRPYAAGVPVHRQPLPPTEDFGDEIEPRTAAYCEGTRLWVRDEIVAWARGDWAAESKRRVFWLQGDAGVGKSTVAAVATSRWLPDAAAGAGCDAVPYFCLHGSAYRSSGATLRSAACRSSARRSGGPSAGTASASWRATDCSSVAPRLR